MVHKEVVHRMMANFAKKNYFDRCISKVKVVSAANGKCDAELKVETEHSNLNGTLHGGLAATLVDIISSYALITHPKFVDKMETPSPAVSVDIHMSYIRAAKVGEEILVRANTVKTGKSLAFLEVSIENKLTGDVLVKGSHTKFLIS